MGVPTWGWRWSAARRSRAGDAGRALPEGNASRHSRRPYGARVGERAWVESDRSVQLKLLTARQAGIAGVALWVRGGESVRDLASAARRAAAITQAKDLTRRGPAARAEACPRDSTARS